MLWKSRKEGILEGDFIGFFVVFFFEWELKEHGLDWASDDFKFLSGGEWNFPWIDLAGNWEERK